MELKDYQQQALDTLERYLQALEEARQQVAELSTFDLSTLPPIVRESTRDAVRQAKDYPRAAWENLRKASVLPAVTDAQGQDLIPEHIPRESTAGEPIPHVCLKVPDRWREDSVRRGGSASLETRHRVCTLARADQSHLHTNMGRFSEQRASVSADSGTCLRWAASSCSKKTTGSQNRISKIISV